MIDILSAALAVAFVITLLEMTEVVALVFALGVDHPTLRPAALGAVSGTAVIATVAVVSGAAIVALPPTYLLWAATITLAGFALFLFRSTVRTYRRARAERTGAPPGPPKSHSTLQFAGGFSVGAVEATEAVIVLLALTAAGSGAAAIVGAVAAGVVLVTVALLLHERIRRIKVPLLKLGATSMLFAFTVFWAGEALRVNWPGSDLVLAPLFLLGLVLVRGGVALALRDQPPVPPPATAS